MKLLLKNKATREEARKHEDHAHYMLTCGSCGGDWPSCGIPCFIFCPHCQCKNLFWEDPKLPHGGS